MLDLKGRNVTVVGLARSGIGAANLLACIGAKVTATDKRPSYELADSISKIDARVRIVTGHHPSELFQQSDLIVISPGVPISMPQLKAAADAGKPIIGELELAYRIVNMFTQKTQQISIGHHGKDHPSFLAVTGTNGKSTTTMLVFEMLKESGFNALLGGNIGTALSEELLLICGKMHGAPGDHKMPFSFIDHIVTEVSSFQLESIAEFCPRAATILNITPDHLDRYDSMNDYIDAKCRIFINQTERDFIVLNADDPLTAEIAKRLGRKIAAVGGGPHILYFSRKYEVVGAYCTDGIIRFRGDSLDSLPQSFSLDPLSFRIQGVHNIENAMAASLMSLVSGCSTDAVASTLETFPGLEHRLEFVRGINEVRFINDSKGTNVGAVVKSLESFNEPIILIAGGRDKHGDFTVLRPLIKEKVKILILIGEAQDAIDKAVGDLVRTVRANTLSEAVKKAKEGAAAGDVVLLSPACASFDMFKDFEDRGRQFKEAVMAL